MKWNRASKGNDINVTKNVSASSNKKMKGDDGDATDSLMRKAVVHLYEKAGNLVDSLAVKLQLRKVKEWRDKLREERDKRKEEKAKFKAELRLWKEIHNILIILIRILRNRNRITAKNGFENKVEEMMYFEDNIWTIKDKCDEVTKWLEANHLAEVEELKNKRKELESVSNHIITKLCQGAGGMGGMPDLGRRYVRWWG